MTRGDSGLSRRLEGGIGGRGQGEQKLEVDRRRARRRKRDVPVVSLVDYTNAGKSTLLTNDTVGFIRDLPKDLPAAFRATLEEIADSDLLVHLVDMSYPRHEAQIKAVLEILRELGDDDIRTLLVFNKCDLVDPERRDEILAADPGSLAIAAAKREGLSRLLREIDELLSTQRSEAAVLLDTSAP